MFSLLWRQGHGFRCVSRPLRRTRTTPSALMVRFMSSNAAANDDEDESPTPPQRRMAEFDSTFFDPPRKIPPVLEDDSYSYFDVEGSDGYESDYFQEDQPPSMMMENESSSMDDMMADETEDIQTYIDRSNRSSDLKDAPSAQSAQQQEFTPTSTGMDYDNNKTPQRPMAEFDSIFFDPPRARPNQDLYNEDDSEGDYEDEDSDEPFQPAMTFKESELSTPDDSSDTPPTSLSSPMEISSEVDSSDTKEQPQVTQSSSMESLVQNEKKANTNNDPPRPAKKVRVEAPPLPIRTRVERAPSDRDEFFAKAAMSNGGPIDSPKEQLERRLEMLRQQIYQQNNGNEFNLNSRQQISEALFGNRDQKTNKETLEAMSGNNVLADLILQYRRLKQEIRRMDQREATKSKRITSFSNTAAVPNQVEASEANITTATLSNDPLLLVDISAYIFRAYYSMPPMHRSGDGMPVAAVMGVCRMLNKLVLTRCLERDEPRVVLVFDAKGPNFRHELDPEYKANRDECPMDLVPQFDLVREASRAYGIPQMEAVGYEADDVIATLATMALKEGLDTHILSGDKDLMQLVTPKDQLPYVHIIDPMTMARVDSDAVKEKWGVDPHLVGDVLALAGDTADNVKGVHGIGPKIAAQLLDEYGSLTELLANVENIKQEKRREKMTEGKEQAILARKLVDLERAIPVDKITTNLADLSSIASLRMEAMNADRILKFYDSMGFKALQRELKARVDQRPTPKRRKSTKKPKAGIPGPEDFADVPF